MYEVIGVTERTLYMNCPAKIGFHVLESGDVWIIDSGNDKEAGKRVLRTIDDRGWSLRGIINTHSNADHIGGNEYLREKTGCAIITSPMEAAFTRFPILEPSFLYGGYPCKDLRNKFLLAKPSPAVPIDECGLPRGFETFPLPGHYFGMMGVRTPDGVCFIGDSLFSPGILQKYHVAFIYDVKAQFATLEALAVMEAAMFIPSHAEPTKDIGSLIRVNKEKMQGIIGILLDLCKEPKAFDDVLKGVMDGYGLILDFNQYVLVGSTIKSYLAYLYDEGRITCGFRRNLMEWRTVC